MKSVWIVLALLSLAGCNMMNGFGTDLQNLGGSLKRAASDGQKQPSTPTPNPGNARVQPNYPVQPLESRELETMPYQKYDAAR